MAGWRVKKEDFQLIPPSNYQVMDESTWSGEYKALGVATNGVEEKKFSATVSVSQPHSDGPSQNLVYQDAVRVLNGRFNAGRLPVLGEDIRIALPGDLQ